MKIPFFATFIISIGEYITGLSLVTLITICLFEPLGISSAGFGPPGTINQIDQPWGYNISNGESLQKQLDNQVAAGLAGRIHCSIEDWRKFIKTSEKMKEEALELVRIPDYTSYYIHLIL